MSEELSQVDDAQLQRWAYGRAATPADQERASRASVELQRRADLERERAERAAAEFAAAEAPARAVATGGLDETEGEHPTPLTDTERRHRRRMLATGIAGVTAAALTLVGAVAVLNQPKPDPVAIFDREETQLDRNWADRLGSWGYSSITAGPRAIEVDDGSVVIAARLSTVPDGRSTKWDSYCLFVAVPAGDAVSWESNATCTYPEKFEREGIVVAQRPSATGAGFDMVVWDPIDGPRLETDVPRDRGADNVASVLDWMVHTTHPPLNVEPEIVTDDDSPLLMGPAAVPLQPSVDAARAGYLDIKLVASASLIRGNAGAIGTHFCLNIIVGDGSAAGRCASLASVRSDGLEVPIAAHGRNWLVRIGADGRDRADTVELLG